jgi:Amt family ammonium transporter
MSPIWLVIFGIGSLLLRAGFALQASGSLRAKNSASAIVRLTAETAAAALSFWAFGFAILYQKHNAWIGIDTSLLFRDAPESAAREFFYMTICLIGSSIVAGAIAERSKFYVGVLASAVLAGVIFPIAGHWVWFGKLSTFGFIDCGGTTVIHLSGAIFGAIGVAVLGSRAGKYQRDGSSSSIPGHSLPMLGVGVMLLLAGWFPYLLGCVCAHAAPGQWDDVVVGITATNIMLAGMGGVAGGLLYSHWRYRKPDLFFTYSGLLGGLVAISSGLVAVSAVGAIVIGVVAGILVPMIALVLDLNARLDDPIGLIAIHGVGAIWGTLATAIFAQPDRFSDHFKLLAIQAGGLATVIILSTVVATILFLTLKQLKWLRVTEADEFDGLDIGEHDINSYPDFQQTTIKSYHLREA